MKKFIALLLTVVMTASVAIGGTLAYLTDRDSEVNTFTVGKVEIDLKEDFVQESTLIPGVKIDKNASIANIGENDAYVWLTVLLPKEMGPYTGLSASNNVIHWNYPQENAANITVDFISTPVSLDPDGDGTNSEYWQTNMLWKDVLAANDETGIMLSTVYMDTHVDITPEGDWYWVNNGNATNLNWNTNTNGNPKIYVSAYAIQANDFADVNAAYAAYQAQWGDNGAEYTPGEETPPADPNATGSITLSYTDSDKIWGEGGGSAKNSFVVKVYSGDTYMGSSSLNNINGIINGDVYVTWNLYLDPASHSDGYWTMNWAIAPTISQQPTRVELWVDGTMVGENVVQLNGPDSLNKIGGAVTDSTGKILRYVVGNVAPELGTGEQYHSFN